MRLEAVGVHRAGHWCVHRVDGATPTDREVVVDRPRVGIEVVAAIELERVDKDADDDNVGVPACFGDQGEVTFVQRAHRWHQRDSLAGKSLLVAPRGKRGRPIDNFQARAAHAISESCVRRRASCRRAPRR